MIRQLIAFMLAPFFAGFCFISDSETSTETNQYDQRTVLGEGSNNAQGGSTLTNYTTTNVVDAGTVAASFDFANSAGGAAFDTVTRTVGGALDFANDALVTSVDAISTANTGALNLATDSLALGQYTIGANVGVINSAFDFASDAADRADSSSRASMTKAFDFGGDALGSVADAFRNALGFAANNAADAQGGMQFTQQLTADAYNDAKGRGAWTDKIILGAVVAMAVVAYMAVRK